MKKYAVIFTSKLSSKTSVYQEKAIEMESLLQRQAGYLGTGLARSEAGIPVCYCDSLDAIKDWKSNSVHLAAQEKGKSSRCKH